MKNIKVDSNKVSANDRPDLEGKIVQYYHKYKGNMGEPIASVVVIGCNRSVGITIVDVNDKDRFRVCIAGPILKDFNTDYTETYDEFYDTVVEQIESGALYSSNLADVLFRNIPNVIGGDADGSSCAYSR